MSATTQRGPVDYMLNAYHGKGDQLPEAELVAQYARGPADLQAALAGLTREQLMMRPTQAGAGSWSTLEVAGHLADCEQFLADRMKRTIALERPLLMGMDENKYMAAFDYQTRDVEEEMAIIKSTRAQMVRILKMQPASAWTRQAVHSEAGLMTLHHILFHATFHIQHHLRFILEKKRVLFSNV